MSDPKDPRMMDAPPVSAEDLRVLARCFGLRWRPDAEALLDQALVHRSFAAEQNRAEDNERLELLGDSVIGFLTTERLLEEHPDANEGELSRRRAEVVSRQTLGEVAIRLGLGSMLHLGVGEDRRGGRSRHSVVGSALEAVAGAIYLAWPWDAARRAIRETIVNPAVEIAGELDSTDYKSRLQEWAQQRGNPVPEYRIIEESGPEHSKTYRVEAYIAGKMVGTGTGTRKAHAQREAARDALSRLKR